MNNLILKSNHDLLWLLRNSKEEKDKVWIELVWRVQSGQITFHEMLNSFYFAPEEVKDKMEDLMVEIASNEYELNSLLDLDLENEQKIRIMQKILDNNFENLVLEEGLKREKFMNETCITNEELRSLLESRKMTYELYQIAQRYIAKSEQLLYDLDFSDYEEDDLKNNIGELYSWSSFGGEELKNKLANDLFKRYSNNDELACILEDSFDVELHDKAAELLMNSNLTNNQFKSIAISRSTNDELKNEAVLQLLKNNATNEQLALVLLGYYDNKYKNEVELALLESNPTNEELSLILIFGKNDHSKNKSGKMLLANKPTEEQLSQIIDYCNCPELIKEAKVLMNKTK
jgi:hypothetical protein